MDHQVSRRAVALALLGLASVSTVWAQPATRVRLRGEIAKVDGQVLTIKERDGSTVILKLADNATVAAIVPASMADIKANSYIGVSSLAGPGGTWRAISVHIFPEAMRGTAEGDFAWDLQPQSMMTNATVVDVVSKVDGNTVTLKYKTGEKTITIPQDLQIVTYAPGDKAELKPGAKIFVIAEKQQDGTFTAARISVGRGVAPPM